jgi:hypothetical protein
VGWGGWGWLEEVGGDFGGEVAEGFAAGFDQDVGGGGLLDGGEGDEDYFGAGELREGVSMGLLVLAGGGVSNSDTRGMFSLE